MPHISHGGRYREVSQLLPGRLQVDVHAPEREVAAVHRHRLPAAHILTHRWASVPPAVTAAVSARQAREYQRTTRGGGGG